MSSKSASVDEGKSNATSELSAAHASSTYSRRGLVAKVESYFYENDDFAQLFENFANEHASVIDLEADKTEFKLEYTDVYNKFLALFESSLSKFIEDQGGTIEDFYDEVREVSCSGLLRRIFVLMTNRKRDQVTTEVVATKYWTLLLIIIIF